MTRTAPVTPRHVLLVEDDPADVFLVRELLAEVDPELQVTAVESVATAWTGGLTEGQELLVPIKSGEGRYVADAGTLERLVGDGRVVFRYLGDNPNGAQADIAGISSADGRVVGLMPHPEHAIDPLTGPSADGLGLFTSVLHAASPAT